MKRFCIAFFTIQRFCLQMILKVETAAGNLSESQTTGKSVKREKEVKNKNIFP